MVYKKLVPQGLKTFQVAQTIGEPGWIIFTYENKIPICLWITNSVCEKINCISDERIHGDTILRAERISSRQFVISDIWLYNSNCIFMGSTFKQRYEWCLKFIKTFTYFLPELSVEFIHKSEYHGNIRGYEEYSLDECGKPGYFIEKDDSEIRKVSKMSLPDCYEVENGGYLRVPDLETSVYLRTKGNEFNVKCKKFDEESWTLTEAVAK